VTSYSIITPAYNEVDCLEAIAPGVHKRPMKQIFENIEGYKVIRHVTMEEDALTLLKLDDYLYTDYQGPNGKITLYIGYYYTATKSISCSFSFGLLP